MVDLRGIGVDARVPPIDCDSSPMTVIHQHRNQPPMSVIAHFKTLLKSNDLFKRQFIVKNKVLLGTHHKTGTFWFGKIFSDIASKLGLEFVASTHEQNVPNGTWDIYQNSHSRFDKPALGEFKGVHVVRDPRDQIISATFYHQTSDEEWLHVPRDEFGGSTYQEKINSFSSFDDRMLFEMEGSAYGNIMAMIEFDHSDERFVTAKFEELITDQRLEKFEDIFEFLGFRGIAMGWCLTVSYTHLTLPTICSV